MATSAGSEFIGRRVLKRLSVYFSDQLRETSCQTVEVYSIHRDQAVAGRISYYMMKKMVKIISRNV